MVRRSVKQAIAVGALLALSSSWVLGWSVALHLADDHHQGDASEDRVSLGLEMALHGHAHSEGTPAHGHPIVGSAAAPLPGKVLVRAGAMIGSPLDFVFAEPSGCPLRSEIRPTHDPPPRPQSVSVLRI